MMEDGGRDGGGGKELKWERNWVSKSEIRNSKSEIMSASLRLADIAHARSGDKGNHANVAVLAYTAEGYEWIKQHLTTDVVAQHFVGLGANRVERFESANVWALNFMLYDAMGGGASRSLRIDTQGKLLGTAVLDLELPRPDDVAAMRDKE